MGHMPTAQHHPVRVNRPTSYFCIDRLKPLFTREICHNQGTAHVPQQQAYFLNEASNVQSYIFLWPKCWYPAKIKARGANKPTFVTVVIIKSFHTLAGALVFRQDAPFWVGGATLHVADSCLHIARWHKLTCSFHILLCVCLELPVTWWCVKPRSSKRITANCREHEIFLF